MIKIHIKDYGVISLEMDYDAAPNSAANFVKIARSGFYEGIQFHRIIKNFMIQAGDAETAHKKDFDYVIKGEFETNGVHNPLKHTRGVISMARTYVNDSACSQFFICHKDAPHLDGQYAAFGHMVDGFDVLDKVAGVRTQKPYDCPYEPVIIEKVEVIDEPDRPVEMIK